MPVSRLITDINHLYTELSEHGPATSLALEELRLTVARTNEIRRQLDIAQVKLSEVLSLAGKKFIDRQITPDNTPHLFNYRFHIPEGLNTGIPEIDDAHRALFQAGNRLCWQALQTDVKAKEVEAALHKFIQSVSGAFTLEEQMMDDTYYKHRDHHRAIHQRMRDYLSDMKELVSTSPLAVVVKLERILGSWFIWHLQGEDVKFGKYVLGDKRYCATEATDHLQQLQSVMHTDPVCGTQVSDRSPLQINRGGERLYFCSSACFSRFNLADESRHSDNKKVEEADTTVSAMSQSAMQRIDESTFHDQGSFTHNPVRELGYLFRGQISSWLISWRERRHVTRTSRVMLSQYRTIASSHPNLLPGETYKFVVMAHTGCDTATANMILKRAEESFAEWPVSRTLKLRDVVHYLTVTEYLDRYGQDFWLRSEINKLVASRIPGNL